MKREGKENPVHVHKQGNGISDQEAKKRQKVCFVPCGELQTQMVTSF